MCRSARLGGDEAGGANAVPTNREVLPTNVKPLHYDLSLEPDLEKFTYTGTVVVEYVAGPFYCLFLTRC
jgi:aminopeptidase 2